MIGKTGLFPNKSFWESRARSRANTARDKEILALRQEGLMSLESIGQKMGITRERIRQILARQEVSGTLKPTGMVRVRDAAKFLKISVSRLRQLVMQGDIAHYGVSRHGSIWFKLLDLEEFLGRPQQRRNRREATSIKPIAIRLLELGASVTEVAHLTSVNIMTLYKWKKGEQK